MGGRGRLFVGVAVAWLAMAVPSSALGDPTSADSCSPRLIAGRPEPALVVIFINGLQTSSPSDDFYPLDYGLRPGADHSAVDSYCSSGGAYRGSSYGPYPASVSGALRAYYGQVAPPPALGGEVLTDTLAQQGAVLLPYSYRGANLRSCPGGLSPPLFHVNASGQSDPGSTDPHSAAGYLRIEVGSIHRCWPDSAIEVIASGGGGLPAEYYWNTVFQAERDGVRHIFTEDSPINGVGHTSIASAVAGRLGAALRSFYGRLWNNLEAIDEREVALDVDGSFRPIGSVGDYAYAVADQRFWFRFDPRARVQSANYGGLLSQVLMDCGGGAVQGCSAAHASFVSPCDASGLSGDQSQELVRICKPVVDYIAAITSADLNAAVTSTRSTSDRGAPPGRYVSGPGPALQSLLYAARPGTRLTFHGTGLGRSAGRVLFSGTPGAAAFVARVISWSERAVTVVVPHAVSGPIIMQTASGAYLPAGGLAVLNPGPVRNLRIRIRSPRPAGQLAYVYVTVLDRRGRPARHARVNLFDGITDLTAETNRRGIAMFKLRDWGVQAYLVHSRGAHAGVRLSWVVPQRNPFAGA